MRKNIVFLHFYFVIRIIFRKFAPKFDNTSKRMRAHKHIETILMTFAAAICMAVATPVFAQEVEFADSVLVEEVDTLNLDPEWYVAPLTRDSVRAGKRALVAANACTIDSVLLFDENGNLTYVSVYEYGDTTRAVTWVVSNGSRIGETKKEYANDGYTYYGATFTWNSATNNWMGVSRSDTVYDEAHKNTSRTNYVWINQAWVANEKYTYEYDAAGRVNKYIRFVRNVNTNELQPKESCERVWYSDVKRSLEINYTAYSGETPTAGNKKKWSYDDGGNIIEYYEYKSYVNGNWGGTGSYYEQTAWLNANKKTEYLKQVWSNGVFENSIKESWHYNGPSQKQTFYEKYRWSNGAWEGSDQDTVKFEEFGTKTQQTVHEHYLWSNGSWAISAQDSLWYNESGSKILDVKYTFPGGARQGNGNRTEWGLTGLKSTITSTWVKGAWVYNTKSVKANVLGVDTVENCTYKWQSSDGGYWKGSGTRTLTISNGAEEIKQSWDANAKSWKNSTRQTTIGSTANPIQTASYKWQDDVWVGTARTDYHYYAAGKPDTVKTYRPIGTTWVDSLRTITAYNASGKDVLTENSKWNGTKWVMQTMKRTDIEDKTIGSIRETVTTIWSCGSDTIWEGVKKDTSAYLAADKKLYEAQYTSWSNGDWVPSYKIEKEYDERENLTLDQRKNWVGNKWQGQYRREFLYDAAGNQTRSAIFNLWNTETSTWIGTIQTETEYNSSRKPISSITYYWGTDDWYASGKTLTSYDASNNPVEQLVQNYVDGSWVNSLLLEKAYRGNLTIKANEYEWVNNAWRMTRRSEQIYDDDAQAKLRREITGSWNNGVLQSFTDNHYFYACDPHLYTIRFCNENGAVLETKQVQNGTLPVYDGAAPTKEPTAEFTYTFNGWDKTIAEASGDATYNAVFTPTKRQYTITFKNGEDVLQSTEVEYGSIPAYNGETPVKQGDAQYTYIFSGWDVEPVAVSGVATYIATFSTATNKYTITFKNGEDVLQSAEVEYGSIPAYNGETPVKQGDAQYTYTFSGWDKDLVAVGGATTYVATFSTTTNKYTITFKNGEDVLQSTEIEYGLVPAYNGETPVKQGDAQYSYVFSGWNVDPVAVSGVATYIATFSTATNKYTITFKNGEDVLQSAEVEYGSIPAYNGETPVKQGDAQYTYTFSGWDKDLVAVGGATTYVATFSTTTNKYTITFKNGEDVLQSTEIEYGLVPAYSGETPVKQGDAEFTYTFAGWNKEITAVAGNETYTATFNTTKNSYIITWLNEDGSEIDHQTLEYGAMPTHADPTKEATAEYTYVFAGWGKEITSVTGNETYTATFTATKRQYTITWLSDDGATIAQDNIAYGLTPAHADINKESTPQYTFSFRGWSPEPTAVTGDAVYTAVFDSVINTYTVTFYFDDGETVLDRQTIPYGEMPSTDMTPAKTGEEHYYYHFAGWSPEVTAVTGDATYIATFTAEPKQYTITFKDYNGRVLLSTNIAYGTMPTYTGETPTRARTAQYTYTFAGWLPELTEVAGDATYTAVYESVLNQYTVLFLDEDGTELDRQTVDYGSTPTYQGETPTKESDEQYSYTFAGWSPRIVAVTKDATYTATYTRHDIHEGIDNIPDGWGDARKVMIDGTLYIRRGSHLYTADGVLVE